MRGLLSFLPTNLFAVERQSRNPLVSSCVGLAEWVRKKASVLVFKICSKPFFRARYRIPRRTRQLLGPQQS